VDTDVTDDLRALLAVSTQFMVDTCPLDVVRDPARRDERFAAAYRRQAAALGWFGMLVPEQFGGGNVSGNGMVDATLIAYHRGAFLQPGPFVGTNVAAYAIARNGSDELRATVLPALLSGEVSAAWAVASGAGGHGRLDAGVEASAAPGGGFRLRGAKLAVADIEAGSHLLVTAAGPDGPVQAVLAADAPGVIVSPLESLDITRRFSEVRFDDASVPATALVGAEALDCQLALAGVLTAAESVGAMYDEFEMTVQYAKDRIAFGRPIGSFQAVKHVLADTSLAVEMAKATVLAAARSLGETIAGGDRHGLEAASVAKALVAESSIELAQDCFQVFGGIGYTWEHDQHLYLRRLTTDAALYGDAAWHREHLCQLAGV
jgi:alkylation response protein AidB-like acyl-CoA dehydrogenase